MCVWGGDVYVCIWWHTIRDQTFSLISAWHYKIIKSRRIVETECLHVRGWEIHVTTSFSNNNHDVDKVLAYINRLSIASKKPLEKIRQKWKWTTSDCNSQKTPPFRCHFFSFRSNQCTGANDRHRLTEIVFKTKQIDKSLWTIRDKYILREKLCSPKSFVFLFKTIKGILRKRYRQLKKKKRNLLLRYIEFLPTHARTPPPLVTNCPDCIARRVRATRLGEIWSPRAHVLVRTAAHAQTECSRPPAVKRP